jgi:hypothetical protein
MARSLYIDINDGGMGPRRGDYIQCIGRGGKYNSCYLVLTSRRVKRHNPNAVPRYTMMVDLAENVRHRPRSGATPFSR